MKPDLARFEQEYKGKLQLVDVNVDDKSLYAQYAKYKESDYIPETVFVKNGQVVSRKVGSMSFEQLVQAFQQAAK